MPAKRKTSRSPKRPYSHPTQIDLFAGEFQSEDHLRRVIADLLRKMGHTGVRITHGANERGKDIAFYAPGPLDEKRLFACVVKNGPITGQAEDHKTGAPTMLNQTVPGVINQISSSFSEPLPNGRGTDEWVDCVYVMSPYECPPATIDSVKTALQRGGQVVFKCGQSLLELFARYWQEFLWFESTVLLSYLSALRKNVESDYALASLILQKSAYLSESPVSSLDRYVQPTFYRELKSFKLILDYLPNSNLLRGNVRLDQINEELKQSHRLEHLSRLASIWTGNEQSVTEAARDAVELSMRISDLWKAAYRSHIAQLRADAARRAPRTRERFAASGMFTSDAFIPPPEKDVAVALNPPETLQLKASEIRLSVQETVGLLRDTASAASRFAEVGHRNSITAIGSAEFLTYCQIAEVASRAPDAIESSAPIQTLSLDEDLLDRFNGSLLITGPAGFGKTTFCRWHVIRDSNRLVAKDAAVLPIYRPLHPLSKGQLGTFEDAFFSNDELKKLIRQQAAGQSPFERIRLYLDGLDEVTSSARQDQIISLAVSSLL